MHTILLDYKTIFVTGAAGFIGSNLVKRLFKDVKDATIVGIDNMNDYYDVALKDYRLSELNTIVPEGITWKFAKGDIADKQTIDGIFEEYKPQVVVNLAAQAGVRYSITNPDAYIMSNMIGFYNILEACRHNPVEHLVYASSSSVYGGNKRYHSAQMTGWIILCRCMQPLRRAMNCLPTAIQNCMISPQQACASLRSMALMVVLIWHTLASPINC